MIRYVMAAKVARSSSWIAGKGGVHPRYLLSMEKGVEEAVPEEALEEEVVEEK
jgi:hypothetical protein